MKTNAEYELASKAILDFRAGLYNSLEEACVETNADILTANDMIKVEDVPETSLREDRQSVCMACENHVSDVCMVCACPMQHLLYNITATCPLEKW